MKLLSIKVNIITSENNKFPINKPPWGTLNAINLNTGKLLESPSKYDTFKSNNTSLTGTENLVEPPQPEVGSQYHRHIR